MTGWLGFLGRLHPMVLHLPIGLLIGLAFVELVAWRRGSSDQRGASSVLACLAAAFAVLAASSGWILSHEEGYGGDTVEWHERAGIAVAIGSVLVAVLQRRPRAMVAYRAALLVTLGILVPAAHLGATITHGADFLGAPFAARPTEVIGASPTYAASIAPILEARCTACHGETKRKGGLALHTPEGILAGGKDGPVLVPGQPQKSEMLRRIRLPLEDEDHMPPSEKAQPSPAQIEAIEAWIAAGALTDGATPAGTNPK